jgi:hemolysin-activating ACP:hemolysin acyltransferase
VKTGARVYQEDVLQGVVKPLNTTLFNGQNWVFLQDSAPAHKAKTTQEWLQRHVPAFISAEDLPSGSPDLKPLDYKLWAFLEDGLPKASQQPGESTQEWLQRHVPAFVSAEDWPSRSPDLKPLDY